MRLCYDGSMDATHRPTAIPLPDEFAFSQSSLQAYVDCARRFWLTYVRQLPWPAVEATPVAQHEHLMRMGAAFHRLIQRAEIGIDPEAIAVDLEDPLDLWFAAYRQARPADLPTTLVEAEHSMSMRLAADDSPGAPAFRLFALYDLLAVEPGERAVIVDWKTSRRRPDPTHLRQRLQTRIYPFLLVEAARDLPWGPLRPDQVEMRYWFTAAPEQPITFRYDAAQHAENWDYIRRLLREILSGQGEDDFLPLPDTEANRARFCRYCVYRSRCDRGDVAGDLTEHDEFVDFDDLDAVAPEALDFTLNDVQELAF